MKDENAKDDDEKTLIAKASMHDASCCRSDCFNESAFELVACIHIMPHLSPITLLCGLDCCNIHANREEIQTFAPFILPHLQFILDNCGAKHTEDITDDMLYLFWMPKGAVDFANCSRGEFKKGTLTKENVRFIGPDAANKNKLN